jgi:hypothetical protein
MNVSPDTYLRQHVEVDERVKVDAGPVVDFFSTVPDELNKNVKGRVLLLGREWVARARHTNAANLLRKHLF